MKQVVIGFALIITSLLILFRIGRLSFISGSQQYEYVLVAISLICIVIGYFLSRKFSKPEKADPAHPVKKSDFIIDPALLIRSGLSNREFEILQLIKDGMSNQQIAEKLFVSENTIKKHISNIFMKMDVSRRTEAVKKGKEMGILE